MKKKWREFERLVARIEKLLSPLGAVVKSPDRIIDKVTGQVREVDASIRYLVGSVPILITIECRDRKAISDDTWIEQLATKKEKIGASHTIAVSSTQFSKPAIESAKHYGIPLRIIKHISDEEILSWAGRIVLENHIVKGDLDEVRIRVYDPDPDTPLHPSVIQAIERDKFQAKIFFSEMENKEVSIEDIIAVVANRYKTLIGSNQPVEDKERVVLKPGDAFSVELTPDYSVLFDNVPEDGLVRQKTIGIGIRKGGLRIETVKGPRDVHRVKIVLAIAKVVEEIPMTRKVRYSTTDEMVTDVVETDIDLFKYDQKKGFVISYKVPKEKGAPVEIIISSDSEDDEKDGEELKKEKNI